MSNQDKNSDPLEEFFREKSQEYDIEYHEEDWQKLEARLDQADQQRRQQRRRWIAAAVIAMLFAVLAYITYDQQLKINELNDELSNQENITTLPPSSDSTDDQSTDPTKQTENEADLLTKKTEQEPNKATNDPSQQSRKDSKIATGQNKDFKQNIEQQSNSTFDISTIEFKEKSLAIAKASPGFDGRSPAISAIKPTNFSGTENTKVRQFPSSPPNNSVQLAAQRRAPRFTIGVLVGPDLSTVGGMSNFYDPGYKFGVSFEYNLTQNLAISAGAQRTMVRYVASGSEYSPPQGYWSYGVVPDKTVGECILIDIPISLKYDVKHFRHSRLYATAGLSSYIMLDEDYKFRYNQSNSSNLKQRWHERTGTTHWMSNATLSVGYELDLSQTLSLRAEPFVKLPLQQVGWGNVNLYSMGTFVSINYKLH